MNRRSAVVWRTAIAVFICTMCVKPAHAQPVRLSPVRIRTSALRYRHAGMCSSIGVDILIGLWPLDLDGSSMKHSA